MFEKLWRANPPTAITAPGTPRGKITLTSTKGFKVKMVVTLADSSLPSLNLQIKRVLSSTQLILGPIDKGIKETTDVSLYGVTSFIYSNEQPRQDIPLKEIERAVYEEEPTVAIRVIYVDPYGNFWDQDNPLPVTLDGASVSVDLNPVTTPLIQNYPVLLPGVETTLTLPVGTKRFEMKVLSGNSKVQFSFIPLQSTTVFDVIRAGCVYEEKDISVEINPLNIYATTFKPAEVIVVRSWS